MGAPDVSDLPSPLKANPAFKPSEAPLFSPTDKSFVLPEEHRPISRHTDWIAADEIPTIDLTPIREAAASGDEAQKEAARKVSGTAILSVRLRLWIKNEDSFTSHIGHECFSQKISKL